MKKILLTLLFVVPLFGHSQTFDVSTKILESTYGINDFASDYIYVENKSGTELDLKFDLISNTLESIGWDATLCTHVLCFPSIPSTEDFGVLQDGNQGYFNIHVAFSGIAGTGEISFRIYEKNNPLNADTITFLYHAGSPTGVDIASKGIDMKLMVYPNPAANYISVGGIVDYNDVTVRIFDMKGVVVYNKEISSGKTINVTQFEKGNYVLEILSEGEKIETLIFVKK